MDKFRKRLSTSALILTTAITLGAGAVPVRTAEETVWIEAEHLLNVNGYCFPDMGGTTSGNWGLSGPGIAPEWSQGGESEWLSVAVGPDDDKAEATYDFQVPVAGTYQVW